MVVKVDPSPIKPELNPEFHVEALCDPCIVKSMLRFVFNADVAVVNPVPSPFKVVLKLLLHDVALCAPCVVRSILRPELSAVVSIAVEFMLLFNAVVYDVPAFAAAASISPVSLPPVKSDFMPSQTDPASDFIPSHIPLTI